MVMAGVPIEHGQKAGARHAKVGNADGAAGLGGGLGEFVAEQAHIHVAHADGADLRQRAAELGCWRRPPSVSGTPSGAKTARAVGSEVSGPATVARSVARARLTEKPKRAACSAGATELAEILRAVAGAEEIEGRGRAWARRRGDRRRGRRGPGGDEEDGLGHALVGGIGTGLVGEAGAAAAERGARGAG